MNRYICSMFMTVVMLLTAVTVFADSTQVMLSACKSITSAKITDEMVMLPEDLQSGRCWGAFGIIQEVIGHVDSKSRRHFYGVCAPPESRRSQLIAIFVNYAEKNPQRLHEDFFWVAIDSLKASFKCK